MKDFARSPLSMRVLSLLAAAVLAAVPAIAQSPQEGGMENAPETSAEERAMMEVWQKAMSLGPQHELLAEGVGEWRFHMTAWMGPEGESSEMEGTVVRSMELGDRVLREELTSSFMGQPFHGIGRTGYDNLKGEWWSTWTDDMSTGILILTGTWDEESRTWMWEGMGVDPMTGEPQPMKMTVKKESADREVVEMWQAGPDGEMRKTAEMVYSR